MANRRCLTHPKTIHKTTNNHLRELEAGNLQHGSNEIASHADKYRPSPAQTVTEGEGEEAADECA